jgi:hypothetical protein
MLIASSRLNDVLPESFLDSRFLSIPSIPANEQSVMPAHAISALRFGYLILYMCSSFLRLRALCRVLAPADDTLRERKDDLLLGCVELIDLGADALDLLLILFGHSIHLL